MNLVNTCFPMGHDRVFGRESDSPKQLQSIRIRTWAPSRPATNASGEASKIATRSARVFGSTVNCTSVRSKRSAASFLAFWVLLTTSSPSDDAGSSPLLSSPCPPGGGGGGLPDGDIVGTIPLSAGVRESSVERSARSVDQGRQASISAGDFPARTACDDNYSKSMHACVCMDMYACISMHAYVCMHMYAGICMHAYQCMHM